MQKMIREMLKIKYLASAVILIAVFSCLYAETEIVKANRDVWFQMTQGVNLAQGIKVRLIPRPDYKLTTDEGDVTDLTDGKITGRKDDRIWFDKNAVGYHGGDHAMVVMDLGGVKPVDHVAVRALGGSVKGFKYPASFEVLISKDAEKWYSASVQTKLQPAEADQADFRTIYYYSEEMPKLTAAMKPFYLPVQADARYLIVRVTMDMFFFSDEIAVIQAE